MTDSREDTVFDIRLNEKGMHYIKKLNLVIWVAFSFMMLFSIGYLLLSIRSIIVIERYIASGEKAPFGFFSRISPYIFCLITLFNMIAGIYYLRFAVSLKKSIEQKNEHGFNLSFRLLYKNAALLIIVAILDSVMVISSLRDVFANGFDLAY